MEVLNTNMEVLDTNMDQMEVMNTNMDPDGGRSLIWRS